MSSPAGFEGVRRFEAVRVWLLGGFRVSVGSRTITHDAWRLRKAAALVKLLALAPGHRMHREQIIDLLWPDSGRRAASNSLRSTLHAARKVLDPDAGSRYLASEDESLVLCPGADLWVDVDAFEAAAVTARRPKEPATHRAALDLYGGELLPEDRYEQWTEGRREELRQLYLTLLVELAGLYEERHEHESAVDVLRRATAEEPTIEEAYVALMHLLALSGRPEKALAQYERLRDTLSRELGTRPAASSRRLRDEIAAGRLPVTPSEDFSQEEELSRAAKHNLPVPRTSFVGREQELVEVKRMLAMTGLLTLTGAGGSGKTRLALEVARDLVSVYPGGVWLAELAGLSEGDLIPQAVAAAMHVPERTGQPLVDTLVETLADKELLLVLDNCEHLAEATARLVDSLLNSCPHLRVLATSREPLDVGSEVLCRVDPLSVPGEQQRPNADEIQAYESVRLFVERALFVEQAFYGSSGFALEPHNASAVAEICRSLEGIPLAIELAAGWVGTLTVEQISERLKVSLGLLKGVRTLTNRQRTLRGAMDWSHDLLSEPDQRLFKRLSVFAGGWTLEAAEAIGARECVEEEEVLELLWGLVNKSLVVAEARMQGAAARYRMLEPIRQYARERLEESGEAHDMRGWHAEFFLALAEDAEPMLWGPEEVEWLDRLEAEHDNFRVALSWSLEHGETEATLRLTSALSRFWETRGHVGEGARWLKEALGKDDHAAPAARAGALLGLGSMLLNQSAFARAEVCFEEALRIYEALGERARVAEALAYLGYSAEYRSDAARAATLFEESLAAARESGNERILPDVLKGLGGIASDAGDFEQAEALWKEALELERELGSNMGASGALFNLGYTELVRGNYKHATALLEETLATGREMGDKGIVATALLGLGIATTLRGEPSKAQALLKEGVAIELELENKMDLAEGLEALAGTAGALDEDLRAARLWGAAATLREATGSPWARAERLLHEPQLVAARGRLDKASWEAAFAEGQAMPFEEAVEYALSEGEPDRFTAPVMPKPGTGEPTGNLTRREQEVATLVARGLINRQIATELMLSEHTVATHMRNVLKKLGLYSRNQIADWFEEHQPLA